MFYSFFTFFLLWESCTFDPPRKSQRWFSSVVLKVLEIFRRPFRARRLLVLLKAFWSFPVVCWPGIAEELLHVNMSLKYTLFYKEEDWGPWAGRNLRQQFWGLLPISSLAMYWSYFPKSASFRFLSVTRVNDLYTINKGIIHAVHYTPSSREEKVLSPVCLSAPVWVPFHRKSER